ncbi:hypothetical protein FACS1894208_00700 [Clostridia bacterium]|nr:hypothetical protein FACS1894208_00700 [Clostridia bacterium]
MLTGFKREALQEQVSYYNNDAGSYLGDDAPPRAVYANIAWCLVDKDRFFEYYAKSLFWEIKLHTALRIFGSKPSLLPKQLFGDKEYRAFRTLVYDYLCAEIGKMFIVRPHELDLNFDENSVHIMLVQANERSGTDEGSE